MKHTSKILLGLAAAFTLTGAMAQTSEPGEGRLGPAVHGDHAPHAITRAQAIEKAAQRFDAADTNKDGVLTPDEMRAAFERGHGERKGPPHEGANGERKGPPPEGANGDHKGPPPPRGMEAGPQHRAEGQPGQGGPGDRPAPRALTRAEALDMAMKRFDAADTNKDGVVTPEEMHAAFERHHTDHKGPPPPPEGFNGDAPPLRH